MDYNIKPMDEIVQFDLPTDSPKIIKVVGVGGGGCNAVSHMYREGIEGVTFMVCNTDIKSLNDSPVEDKLLLGEGLGAGNDPDEGRKKAEASVDEIKKRLDDGTLMVFITAGMGGGTGTGAAPIVAKAAKEMGILSVGIVTIPYRWEGIRKIDQALDGVEEISKYVDALIVVKNDKLLELYNDLELEEGYDRADDIVLVAAKSISDIITMHGKTHLDFNDVRMVLKDGGVAIIGTGYGSGDGRLTKAIQNAQTSPLLNDNDIFNAKKVVVCISYSSQSKLMVNELYELREFMSRFGRDIVTKHGVEKDETLGEQVKVTLLATGFGIQDIHMEEMDKRLANRSEEELEAMAQEEERRQRRREKYGYGRETGSSSRRLRKRHTYLFRLEDLDNDELIALVAESPTYQRDIITLNGIKRKAEELEAARQTASLEEETGGGDGVISFG